MASRPRAYLPLPPAAFRQVYHHRRFAGVVPRQPGTVQGATYEKYPKSFLPRHLIFAYMALRVNSEISTRDDHADAVVETPATVYVWSSNWTKAQRLPYRKYAKSATTKPSGISASR